MMTLKHRLGLKKETWNWRGAAMCRVLMMSWRTCTGGEGEARRAARGMRRVWCGQVQAWARGAAPCALQIMLGAASTKATSTRRSERGKQGRAWAAARRTLGVAVAVRAIMGTPRRQLLFTAPSCL